MFTSNKKKSQHSRLPHESFDTLDFLELGPITQPLNRKTQLQSDKQNIAKDILIQIGQSECVFLDKTGSKNVPISIDSWTSGLIRNKNVNKFDRLCDNNYLFTRNARSVTTGLIKYKDQCQQNVVLKLKQALKKLESPEKIKIKSKKTQNENKNEILQSLISKRKVQTKVSDLIRLKQCEALKTNIVSSNFHSRKISTSMENRNNHKKLDPFNQGQPLDTRKMNELFNFHYKQARKNRTLKGILN